MQPLLSDEKTANETLGLLVAFALHNLALSSLFELSMTTNYPDIDRRIQDMEPLLGTIRYPGAVQVIFSSIGILPAPYQSLRRYYIYKLLERLATRNHRNYVILSSLDLIGPLFKLLRAPQNSHAELAKPERQVIMRLLKRLLELGSGPQEATTMFQHALNSDCVLNGDALEIIRAGMKTRWPEHFTLEGPSALSFYGEPARGLPFTGFTFMVSFCDGCLTFHKLTDLRNV